MRYFVQRDKHGDIKFFAEYPYENQTMIEVSKEAYERILTEHEIPVMVVEPTEQEDMAAMAIDHEYRLTLLAQGVTNDAV